VLLYIHTQKSKKVYTHTKSKYIIEYGSVIGIFLSHTTFLSIIKDTEDFYGLLGLQNKIPNKPRTELLNPKEDSNACI
jgi:hypothetical protein